MESSVSLSWCIRQGTRGEGGEDADYLPPQDADYLPPRTQITFPPRILMTVDVSRAVADDAECMSDVNEY